MKGPCFPSGQGGGSAPPALLAHPCFPVGCRPLPDAAFPCGPTFAPLPPSEPPAALRAPACGSCWGPTSWPRPGAPRTCRPPATLSSVPSRE